MKQKRTIRKALSLLLVLCMMLGICPITLFATRRPTLNLVSLGDSMTNGYGHDGYYAGSTQVNGFRQNDVSTTYPYRLKQMLESTYDVNWEALAVSCMRTEDVNFLLRYHTNDDTWNTLAAELDNIDSTVDNWNDTQKARWDSTFIDDGNVIGDYFTWNEFVNDRFWDWQKTTGNADEGNYTWNSNPTLAYANYYQDAVKNADVITLGTGNANFGVIMLQNITSYLTGTFGSGFKDAVPVREVLGRRLPAEVQPKALEILDKVDALVVPMLGMLGEEKAAKVLEIVEYTTASFMFSYIDMLYAIDELNDKDNLDVIMMGLMNTMDGVKIDLGGGQIFDLGAVVDGITDVLSTYYFVLPVALQELKGDFENITFYIVPNDDHIEMQISDMADLGKIKASPTIRERMIQEVSGMIFNLVRGGTEENPGLNGALKAALGNDAPQLPNWSMNDNTAYQYREKVEAYEQLQADYKAWVDGGHKGLFASEGQSILDNPNDALACAVYLAFEQAIIANADNATLDLNGLMSLMGGTTGLADMMEPIAGAMNLDPSALIPNVTAAVGANAGNYIVTPKTTPNPVPPVPSEVTLLVDSNAANDDAARADGATYRTIQGALAKAQNGDTIKLVTDIETNNVVYIGGATGTTKLILDLNGKTLTSSYVESGRVAVEAQSNVDVTIQNGTIISTGTAATVFVKGGTGNNSKLTLVDVTVENKLTGAWYNVYVQNNSVPALVLKGATTLIGGGTLIGGNNPTVAVEAGIYNFDPASYVNGSNFNVTGPYVPDPTTLQPMFTVIELTNALNGALGTALVSEDAASLGGLLSLYARMIIGNGIGSHPTANGHQTLFNEIAEVYPDKPAQAYLTKVVKDTAEMLYKLAKSGNTETLDKIVTLAHEQGLINEAQAELIKAQLPTIYVAVYEKDDEAIMNSCKKLAVQLYDYGRENGYINDEIHAIVTETIRVYTDVKDMGEDEIIEYAKKYITNLIGENDIEILDAIKLFVTEQDWVTENEISACTVKIEAVKAAVESGNADAIASTVKDLAEFLSEVYKAKEPALEALKDQFMGLYAKLEWYATPRKAGPYTNVVTIGASNVNGYGLRGYLKPTDDYNDDTVMEAAALNSALKSGANVLGYNQAPSASYPALLKKALEEQQGNIVNLFQLAISSMRAEELRILLDNNYNGDAYSAWRFIDNDPDKGYTGWFDIADGNADGDFSQLRSEYQTAVKNADLITVDIGVNNFGVYLSYMLTSNFSLDNNLELVDPQIGKLYNDAKAQVNALFAEYGISMTDYEELADTLVYALVGFCYNFDKSMERIYELNPDATVVVVSIQNLMAGLKAEIGGIEVPFGDMMGALVNTANAYIHYASPFAAKYLYTDVAGDEGRVEFFIDKMAAYDGNPANLDENIIDCFDVWDGNPKASYDGGFHVKYQLAKLAIENSKATAENVAAYLNGDEGKALLYKAYDAYAQIMSTAAKYDTLDLSALTVNSKPIEAALTDAIWNAVRTAVTTEGTYTLPDNFFSPIATYCGVSESVVKTIAAMAVRTDIGNSFFGHPTPAGHVTVADKILNTLNYEKTGLDWLYENINNLDEKLYELVVEYGPEALTYVKNYAIEQGWITAEQIALVEGQINAAIEAYNTKNYDAVLANCKAMAKYLYEEACKNGFVPAEVQEAIAKAIELYEQLADMTPDELKAYAKEQLKALAEEYGPEALAKLNEYVLSLDVLDERQLGELEAKIWDFIQMYPNAPDATIDAAIDELVDFLFEITELDKDKVMEMYKYLTTTSKEQMIEDAAELMQKYLDKYGPEALECVKNYLIAEGYVTAEEIAEITKQVELAIAAYEAQDKAAVQASCMKLAELVYAYADQNGYIPAEVKEAYAKAIELYNKYGEMTPEQIKAFAVAELKKLIAEHKAEALIALQTYVVNEGWVEKANDLKALAEKIAAAIAAYEADPEGIADAMVEELVSYLYEKAVAEGYIDPAKVDELHKFVDLIKAACEYFVNTSEEQMKADAIALMFDELDKLTDGKINAKVYAQVKSDVAGLIATLKDITPENIQAVVNAYIESIKTKYLALIDDATHGKYVPDGESYYVALGGNTVYGTGIGKYDDGYFDLLLEELGLDVKTQYKNLGEKNLDLTKLLAYIEKNADEIKKADLITYQADSTAFILAVLNEETPDWSKYLTEEQIAFVEEALPVIRTILEDDWTKYADLDANKIVDGIKAEVFGAIDDAIIQAFNDQTDKLDELLSICVMQVKSYVEYIQEQAFELYLETVIGETVLYYSLMEPVNEVLGEDWASYADLDVEQIVSKIKSEVLAKAGEVKGISEEKIPELLERCVEKALELHEYADAEIAKLPEYFRGEELAFAQATFDHVWNYVLSQWPELAELNVAELHDKAYAEIMKLLTEADNFNYEQYVDLGAEKIEEILNCCVDKAMTAIEDIQSRTAEAVAESVIVKAGEKFLEEALKFAVDYLAEDWTVCVDKSAAWISNQIKDAVIAEMYKYSSFGKEYIDQYADGITAILTTCIESVQNVLQTAQNKKNVTLNVLNTMEPFKPYIEKLLFASVAYAVDTAKAVDAIQTINPNATLIVVGMYNPLDGLEIVMDGKTIDVGAYMDYLIDATNVYYTALAVSDGGFTFVAVPDTKINGFETAINVDELNINQLGSMLLNLNDSMYASADGHKYIFEQIMGALDTTNDAPEVDNRTKETAGTFDAVVTFEDDNKTAVVECDQACVVLAKLSDGSYVKLNAVKRADDTYTFDFSGVSGDFSLVVALKGDYNLDGTVTTNDVAQANKALVNHTDPSELQNYVFDMTSDDAITTNDVAKVNKSLVSKTAIEW